MPDKLLILGAAGRLGYVAAEHFRDAGWEVRSLVRPGTAARAAQGTEIVEVHALNEEAVTAAAAGADVVLHALNPPYTDWPRLVPQFMEVAIAAARATQAVLIFPGNVYNFGAGMPPVLTPETPPRPSSRKGALRAAAEAELEAAARDGGVKAVVLRAGDFYGGPGVGSWFDRIIVRNIAQARITYPGPLDAVHEWAYLPDYAAALVQLAQARARLPGFARLGFPGHAVTGREFVRAVQQAAGRRRLRIGGMPWWFLRLVAPLVPIYREIAEMAYLWETPHRIDGSALRAVIGDVPHTPFEAAVAAALHDLASDRR